ncbi:hypothetical protein PPTG_11044 [Phytophthora nicotianae INRA-310]|uniref:PA domain-containing protein n=1 Tax=Phytophthora nicotianae (strain INRA-310) TaxID=761204 RepID=W2Q7Y7_PHYN3|nr:hypothetical protein PPTG_11044 [Phytophthora nicotianae INRA-310]ETN08976.1 hypothetical protein PPTG_11044 [Phytophthora nicotianae INRA-310]
MLSLLLVYAAIFILRCTNVAIAGKYPVGPNRFLGTCLDSAWVTKMEAEKGVSSQERDSSGRLVHPFMQAALKYPRYTVDDPRTAAGTAYTDACLGNGVFYGANQPSDGSSRGEVKGTLSIDVGDWDSHVLASMVAAVVAEEVIGYKVSLNYGGPTAEITMRMSSAKTGICTPTHFNVETWPSSSMSRLRVYFNESYLIGGVGYFGGTGLYTTHQFVLDAAAATPPYFPGFWMDYKMTDTLINRHIQGLQKSEACTQREAAGKVCLVVAMMYPRYDRGYFQAVVSNLGIAAYFCFIGYDGVNQYAHDAAKNGTPVIFIHWEPEIFHVTHKGLFDRIFLPRTDPERVKLSTADYGENGYGKKTNNPVDVDYPNLQPIKFAASIVKNQPAGSLFSKFSLGDADINNVMTEYVTVSSDTTEPSPYFRAACNWSSDRLW